jgi:hypothetical protein
MYVCAHAKIAFPAKGIYGASEQQPSTIRGKMDFNFINFRKS